MFGEKGLDPMFGEKGLDPMFGEKGLDPMVVGLDPDCPTIFAHDCQKCC
jgi:hypothetical protein